MKPLKASLFFFFCVASIGAIGTAFSHLWRTNKEVQTARQQISSADLKIHLPTVPAETAPQ